MYPPTGRLASTIRRAMDDKITITVSKWALKRAMEILLENSRTCRYYLTRKLNREARVEIESAIAEAEKEDNVNTK